MPNIVQAGKIERFPIVGLHHRQVLRGDDLLVRWQPLEHGQCSNLPSANLLHVHVHHLWRLGQGRGGRVEEVGRR